MEASNDRDYQERRTGPTVSKEKWVNHAKAKLARGYVLIVGKNRRTANFFLKNKGYEMCGYDVAKQLIREGSVVEAGEQALGTIYVLAAHAAESLAPEVGRKIKSAPIDEMDVLLNQVARDSEADSSARPAPL